MKQYNHTNKRDIYFATSNYGKLCQINQIFNSNKFNNYIKIIPIMVDIDEIQSIDNVIVAKDKIVKAYKYIQNKLKIDNFELICEDTGYNFDNMNGFPGALIRFYHDQIGSEGICKFNGGNLATNVSVVAYKNGNNIKIFKNSVRGKVALKPASLRLDSTFIPDYKNELSNFNFNINININILNNLTYAQIPSKLKNLVSARGKSYNDLKKYLYLY